MPPLTGPSSDEPSTPPRPKDLRRPEDEDTPLVCFCMHVPEATLRRAVERGADSVHTLSDWTAAGMGCGTCRSELERILAEGRSGD